MRNFFTELQEGLKIRCYTRSVSKACDEIWHPFKAKLEVEIWFESTLLYTWNIRAWTKKHDSLCASCYAAIKLASTLKGLIRSRKQSNGEYKIIDWCRPSEKEGQWSFSMKALKQIPIFKTTYFLSCFNISSKRIKIQQGQDFSPQPRKHIYLTYPKLGLYSPFILVPLSANRSLNKPKSIIRESSTKC